MIELIETNSPKAVGVKICGKIEKSDVEDMIKAIEEKLEQGEKLGIYVEYEAFGGISLDALVEDIKFGIPNIKNFNKKAVVSGKDWLGKLVEISDKLFPSIEVRHYSLEEKEEAMEWVRAG